MEETERSCPNRRPLCFHIGRWRWPVETGWAWLRFWRSLGFSFRAHIYGKATKAPHCTSYSMIDLCCWGTNKALASQSPQHQTEQRRLLCSPALERCNEWAPVHVLKFQEAPAEMRAAQVSHHLWAGSLTLRHHWWVQITGGGRMAVNNAHSHWVPPPEMLVPWVIKEALP